MDVSGLLAVSNTQCQIISAIRAIRHASGAISMTVTLIVTGHTSHDKYHIFENLFRVKSTINLRVRKIVHIYAPGDLDQLRLTWCPSDMGCMLCFQVRGWADVSPGEARSKNYADVHAGSST